MEEDYNFGRFTQGSCLSEETDPKFFKNWSIPLFIDNLSK